MHPNISNPRWFAVLLLIAASAFFGANVSAQYSVEYFWDTDPGVGRGIRLTMSDETSFNVTTQISTDGLSLGIHRLGLRALTHRDDGTVYPSMVDYRRLYVMPDAQATTTVEYFWDTDPGIGRGTKITASDATSVNVSTHLSTENLSSGIHRLGVRALTLRDGIIYPSLIQYHQFFITPVVHTLTAVEYFWDTDPGVGNGTKISATADSNHRDSLNFTISADSIAEGIHRIGLRALTDGTWSLAQWRKVYVRKAYDDQVARVEYYWDVDPSYGNGTPIQITPGSTAIYDGSISVIGMDGKHTMYIRAQSGSGNWSPNYKVGEISLSSSAELIGDVNDDGVVNITDAVLIVNYLNSAASENFNVERADVNNDKTVDIDDAITIFNMLFVVSETTDTNE